MRTPPDDPDTFLRRGRDEYEAGRLEAAAAAFQRALELQYATSWGPAAFGLGVVRLQQGDKQGACAALRLAIASGDAEYAPRAALFMAVWVRRDLT
jgi:tetratricopeptide (TPR) repeat protein